MCSFQFSLQSKSSPRYFTDSRFVFFYLFPLIHNYFIFLEVILLQFVVLTSDLPLCLAFGFGLVEHILVRGTHSCQYPGVRQKWVWLFSLPLILQELTYENQLIDTLAMRVAVGWYQLCSIVWRSRVQTSSRIRDIPAEMSRDCLYSRKPPYDLTQTPNNIPSPNLKVIFPCCIYNTTRSII
jgi:hypothetical protein